MIKLVTVVGARPQFIKAATLSRVVADGDRIEEILVHTGQHFDANMSEIFFAELDIPRPKYHLGIGGGRHGSMTGRQLEKIEEVLLEERPDWVLVYGDTNSTLAGALAAAKLHIPVAHVEAGLRSYNRRMPEEINRVLTDHVSTSLFAPTQVAQGNLIKEGIAASSIHVVGDVMYDAAKFYRSRAKPTAGFLELGLTPGSFVLCTIHRAENTDDPQRLRAIFDGLAASGLPILLPLHPRTRGSLQTHGIVPSSNIRMVDPVGYLEMVWLEAHCRSIATDSGGVQKEAFFHGKPCVTLRDETEWTELVEIGANVLVGADARRLAEALATHSDLDESPPLYGDGRAAHRIADILAGTS